MSAYNIIAASNESTVVAEYTPESALSDKMCIRDRDGLYQPRNQAQRQTL